MALPPVFAASALYDNLLQAALRQFFGRATFETEPIPSLSSDGRLAIEPTNDPSVLTIRWFGSRYVLHVPARRPFTPHEVRLARAIGIGARAALPRDLRSQADARARRAVPRRDRGSLRQRVPRHAGAGDRRRVPRADLLATAIEVLRVAALSSYENHAISSGVLCSTRTMDREHGRARRATTWPIAIRRRSPGSRASTGCATASGRCSSSTATARCSTSSTSPATHAPMPLEVPCPTPYRAHALATVGNQKICIVLSPSHEIKVFAEGVQIFSFRNARWHLLDVKAKYDMWEAAVGNRALAERLFQTALDLADARQGALFVVLRDPADVAAAAGGAGRSARCAARHAGRFADARPDDVHAARADGQRRWTAQSSWAWRAPTAPRSWTRTGRLLAIGAILLHTEPPEPHSTLAVEGARTTAAMAAGRMGAVLKVSEDGLITFYDQQERIWDI